VNKIQSQCDQCQTIHDGMDGIACCNKSRLGNIDAAIVAIQIKMRDMWTNKKNCSYCYHAMVSNGLRKRCTLNKDPKAKTCTAYKFYIQQKEEV